MHTFGCSNIEQQSRKVKREGVMLLERLWLERDHVFVHRL
jgi:hypothetical protein